MNLLEVMAVLKTLDQCEVNSHQHLLRFLINVYLPILHNIITGNNLQAHL